MACGEEEAREEEDEIVMRRVALRNGQWIDLGLAVVVVGIPAMAADRLRGWLAEARCRPMAVVVVPRLGMVNWGRLLPSAAAAALVLGGAQQEAAMT